MLILLLSVNLEANSDDNPLHWIRFVINLIIDLESLGSFKLNEYIFSIKITIFFIGYRTLSIDPSTMSSLL